MFATERPFSCKFSKCVLIQILQVQDLLLQLQLVMWFLNLKKIGLTVFEQYSDYRLSNAQILYNEYTAAKATFQFTCLVQAQKRVPYFLRAMFLGMLQLGFVWGGLAVLPMSPLKPPNTAQVRPIFKHDVVLCCWAEPYSRCILLCLG